MKVDMLMPQMGESIAEATISKWLKVAGDSVKKDEVILEISTDKVDSEIPSPATGTLVEVLYKQGDVVPVKTKIAVIDTEGVKGVATPTPPSQNKVTTSPSPKIPDSNGSARVPMEPSQERQMSVSSSSSALSTVETSKSGRFYSPLVKSLAEKHGVALAELDAISGSGLEGRVNKTDFLSYVESRKTQPGVLEQRVSRQVETKTSKPPTPTTEFPSFDWAEDGTKIVPMDNMRQAIAEHMVRSKHTSPHVYSVQEVDMTNVSKYRKAHKDEFQEKEGFNLSFTPFFLEAAVKALLHFPYVNASVEGKKIILKRHVNLGCAVALGDANAGGGLIVPVVRKAEERNFVGLARSLNDLATRARNKRLLPDEVLGGTFTVTNPGVFGTIIGNPIINQPQVAILCLGAIKKRPVVIDDMIAIREICYLTLSYDHRIVDGMLGGQFLGFIREYLESWDMERVLY